jgi:hypothetical protein
MNPNHDLRITTLEKNDEVYPSSGFAYSLMVIRDNKVVGYILTEDLGFDTVREWMDARIP